MERLGNILLRLALLLPLCVTSHVGSADEESEIPLSEVPDLVLDAVRKTRPDIHVHSAARLSDESGMFYEIEGNVGEDELEFVVSPDGRIVETDRE